MKTTLTYILITAITFLFICCLNGFEKPPGLPTNEIQVIITDHSQNDTVIERRGLMMGSYENY